MPSGGRVPDCAHPRRRLAPFLQADDGRGAAARLFAAPRADQPQALARHADGAGAGAPFEETVDDQTVRGPLEDVASDPLRPGLVGSDGDRAATDAPG